MSAVFLIFFFLIAFCIVALVLLQEGKGGGLTGMSAGMDGVMGARNPLRRMTAWLFAVFVVMCLAINWYFHQRVDSSLPEAMKLPELEASMGDLRPESAAQAVGEAAAAATEAAAEAAK